MSIVIGKVTGAEECFDSLHKLARGIWDLGQVKFGLGPKDQQQSAKMSASLAPECNEVKE